MDSQIGVIYFAFDSSEVAEEDRPLVEMHAAFLAANPGVNIKDFHAFFLYFSGKKKKRTEPILTSARTVW